MNTVENIEVHIPNLRTVHNYARDCGVTYKAIDFRIRAGSVHVTFVDGVKFIDVTMFPPVSRITKGGFKDK